MNPHSAVIIVAGSSAVGELQVEPHDQPEPELQPVTGLYHVVVTTGGRWSSQSIASAESAGMGGHCSVSDVFEILEQLVHRAELPLGCASPLELDIE